VFQPVACDLMSISPKLSNSTPAGNFAEPHDRLRIQPAVLAELMARYEYQLKFVVEAGGRGRRFARWWRRSMRRASA
jgi:7-carboxy-7-deazaguanine synthase